MASLDKGRYSWETEAGKNKASFQGDYFPNFLHKETAQILQAAQAIRRRGRAASIVSSQSSYLGGESKPVAFFSKHNHKEDSQRQLMSKSGKKANKGKTGR